MASTYTPYINLEKPGYEDYPNVWDGPINANMDKIDAEALKRKYWTATVATKAALPGSANTSEVIGNLDGRQLYRYDGSRWRHLPTDIYITVGDGVNSFGDYNGVDTAIQAALNALPARGGTVFVKAGSYTPTAPIVMPDDTRLFGENPIFNSDIVKGTLINIVNGNYTVTMHNQTVLANILFYDSANSNTHPTIYATTKDGVVIENCALRHDGHTLGIYGEASIKLVSCNHVLIQNNKLLNGGSLTAGTIHLDTCTHVRVKNNYIEQTILSGGANGVSGIWTKDCEYLNIANNSEIYSRHLTTSGTIASTNQRVNGNLLIGTSSNYGGITTGNISESIDILGNIILNGDNDHCITFNATNSRIVGNIVFPSVESGSLVGIRSSYSDVTMAGNIIRNRKYAIYYSNNNQTMLGNIFYAIGTTSIYGGGGAIIVNGNVAAGGKTLFYVSNTGANVMICGNTSYSTAASGSAIEIQGSYYYAIVGNVLPCDGSTARGLAIGDIENSTINANVVYGYADEISVDGDCVNIVVVGNQVYGASGGTIADFGAGTVLAHNITV